MQIWKFTWWVNFIIFQEMMKVENLVIVKDWKRESLEGNLEVKVLKK